MRIRYVVAVAMVLAYCTLLIRNRDTRERWREKMQGAVIDPYDRELCRARVDGLELVAWPSSVTKVLAVFDGASNRQRFETMTLAIAVCENAALEQMQVAALFSRAHSLKLRRAAAAIEPLNCAALAQWLPLNREVAMAAIDPALVRAETSRTALRDICYSGSK